MTLRDLPPAYDYVNSMPYETLLRRAHGPAPAQARNGEGMSTMQNLIWAETGQTCVSHLPPFSKQLEAVKGYIITAIDKLTHPERQIKAAHKSQLASMKRELTIARTSAELVAIVREAVELTNEYKHSMSNIC